MPQLIDEIQQDPVAIAVASALATANARAIIEGVDLDRSLVTIAEEAPPPDRIWRIHYGPRDYVNRRGGDLIFLVRESSGQVESILRGQ